MAGDELCVIRQLDRDDGMIGLLVNTWGLVGDVVRCASSLDAKLSEVKPIIRIADVSSPRVAVE